MRHSLPLGLAALLCAATFAPSRGDAHSRRIAHGPTTASLVGVAPPDGVSPRLILRHRTDAGAAVEADPVTLRRSGEKTAFAEHAHGTPLLATGLSLRTELVLDAPTVCAASQAPESRYRLRDLANALRHTFTPGERIAVTLLGTGSAPQRFGPADSAAGLADWLTTACAAAPPPATPFDSSGWRRLMKGEGTASDSSETVVHLLVTAGSEPRLTARDAALLGEVGVALLESFALETPAARMTDPTARKPGTYQTDPIVDRLRKEGLRREPPAGSGWTPFCDALRKQGGRCLLGARLSGANAMTMQRLLGEAQSLFVTPVSCLPAGGGTVVLSTPTASSELPADALLDAQCDRWMMPGRKASANSLPLIAAAGAAILAGLFVLRRRSAVKPA